MVILLPPSETKRAGGDGPPLKLNALATPRLRALRAELVDDLVGLAANPKACRTALGISPAQDAEIERNATLRTSPTMPAINRYTGVLYDALDIDSLSGAAAARARARLAIGSALFGLLRADDPIPAYRLSASSKLPGRPALPARWRPVLEPVLADIGAAELVVDLRSGAYAGLGGLPGAVRADVLAGWPADSGEPLQQGAQGQTRPSAGRFADRTRRRRRGRPGRPQGGHAGRTRGKSPDHRGSGIGVR